MSQPLLVTGTIGIDTILTPGGRADGVLGGSVSFAAVAALLFADRVDAVSIIGEDFPAHYEAALEAKGLCMKGVERKKGPSFACVRSGAFEEPSGAGLLLHGSGPAA